jgi:hypothetical protein
MTFVGNVEEIALKNDSPAPIRWCEALAPEGARMRLVSVQCMGGNAMNRIHGTTTGGLRGTISAEEGETFACGRTL